MTCIEVSMYKHRRWKCSHGVNVMHFHALLVSLLFAATQTGAVSAYCAEPTLHASNDLCVCPSNCVCYTWSKLRRVDCVQRRLANINARDVPLKVQVLDISDNSVAELTDGYFWGLSQIQYLYVARNALHNLEPFSLSGLRRLTVLDLSDNRLRILPPRLFAETPRLKELRLAGNHLVSASPSQKPLPMVEARHLQELDVSRCQLAHLSASAFVGVLNLISLNVSNNHFLQLPTQAFKPLRSLRYLQADGNPFNCDTEMGKVTSLLKNNNVTTSGLCEARPTSTSPPAPFARMVALGLTDRRSYEREYEREYEPDYPFDWEREEPIVRPEVTVKTVPEMHSDIDRCIALTKPERFFKFEYSNLFAVIIGFKIGFVTALLMLKGCTGNGHAPSRTLPTDHAARARLLLANASGQRVDAETDGVPCESERRPETPPPSYHELRFNR